MVRTRSRRVGVTLGVVLAVGVILSGVTTQPARADSWQRYEEDHGSVSSSGTWTQTSDVNFSGGTARHASSATAYREISCPANTTGLRWIGPKSSGLGIAAVSVDGGSETSVDQYNATSLQQQTLHEVTGLTPGVHTLKVRATNTKNALSSSVNVRVDAFECFEVTPATTTTSTTAAPTTTTSTTVPPTTTTTVPPDVQELRDLRDEVRFAAAVGLFLLAAGVVASWGRN